MKKILIVDDDPAFRAGLAARLRASGFTPIYAVDGVSAVQVARRDSPDLVLLDIGLPAGDGFIVMSRLQQLMSCAGIPIVIITARPPDGNKERALEGGAHAFLQKPIDSAQLLSLIGDILGVPA